MTKSVYVCKRCGLAIGVWAKGGSDTYWKHHASGTTGPSCGKRPITILRKEYDKIRVYGAMLDVTHRFIAGRKNDSIR